MSDFSKGDPVIITIGRRTYHGNFVRWLKGYRAKVWVPEMNEGPSDWTVSGLCLSKPIGTPKAKKAWPKSGDATGSLRKDDWK
jgi:hypothetical protein